MVTGFGPEAAKLAYSIFIHRTGIPKELHNRNANGRVDSDDDFYIGLQR